MEKIWISGAEGHIGSALVHLLADCRYKFIATDKREVDITDWKAVHSFCKISRPDIIINCSGITDLQECEQNPDLAFAVNAGQKRIRRVELLSLYVMSHYYSPRD